MRDWQTGTRIYSTFPTLFTKLFPFPFFWFYNDISEKMKKKERREKETELQNVRTHVSYVLGHVLWLASGVEHNLSSW